MNWLESAIASISPQLARDRALSRLQLASIHSYEGAKRRRGNSDWNTSTLSANEDLRYDIEHLRDRARDLVRNNQYGAKAINSLVGHMIGTGIMPRITDEGMQPLRDNWSYFWDQCDFEGDTDLGGLQTLCARGMVESGEALIIMRPAPSSLNLKIPMQLQVLESDHLDGRKNETQTNSGGRIIQGIELDASGRRVAYWIFDRHPGDAGRSKQISKRIPATQVIHLFEKKRAGQLRDVSWFAPAMLRMRDLADYDDAELMAKKLQACFGLAIVKNGDSPIGSPVIGKDAEGRSERQIKIKPGMVPELLPGEDIRMISPPGTSGYAEYTTKQLRAIAAGIGVTYEMLTGDLSQVNYSSFRAGMLDFRQRMDQVRWHLWVPRFCNPVWQRFAELSSAMHGTPSQTRVEWTPPRYHSVDPMKDYKALLVAVRAGFMSLQQAISEQGEDPQTILEEIERMNQMLDDRGIVVDSDPRQRTLSGAEASSESQNDPQGRDNNA